MHEIEEFDSIDELRKFDDSYFYNTRSSIIKNISNHLGCTESELSNFTRQKHGGDYLLFTFLKGEDVYQYNEQNQIIMKI